MDDLRHATILEGDPASLKTAFEAFRTLPVDREWMPPAPPPEPGSVTLASPCSVTGPGTFFGRAQRTLHFNPSENEGWWFERTDLPDASPIRVSVNTVWNTLRNIVLCSGSPRNYMRMVEHIVALRLGLGVDNVVIRMDSGDPPLFELGSRDLVEAFDRSGRRTLAAPARYVTVTEPVVVGSPRGAFLCFEPCSGPRPVLDIDCAIDFKTAIGRQRLRVRVTPETFRYGALARTNCTFAEMLYCKTIGKIFADVRNLGYTLRNILVAGRRRYINKPGLLHEGKSLEAVWHRTMLDLVAALALVESGRFVGRVTSYKAGHALDVTALRVLAREGRLAPWTPPTNA